MNAPLDRFTEAQDAMFSGFETALAEVCSGRKRSHWIWYIFPQLVGLGRSSTAQFFALRDIDEACDYLRDATLRGRLLAITEAAAAQLEKGNPVEHLMGGTTDALKLISCMTLFHHVTSKLDPSGADPEVSKLHRFCGDILLAGEAQGFPRCQHTLNKIG